MNIKGTLIAALVVAGIYFLVFHTPPFPFSHEAIGLPPYHVVHAGFGVVLLVFAWYLGKRSN